jgi:hypothetical protein
MGINVRKVMVLFVGMVFFAVVRLNASNYILRESLEDLPSSAVRGDAGNISITGGRLPTTGATSLKKTYLKWAVYASDIYSIEYWLKPTGWDGLTEKEIEFSRFIIGKKIYRLYKASGSSELILEAGGTVLQGYPVYNWTEQEWMKKDERARWHYINIGVEGSEIRLSVDGFSARVISSAVVSGTLSEFTLIGSEGTSFSELNIVKGVMKGEELRGRYRSLYRGMPSLQKNTITVPFVDRPPVTNGAIEEDEYKDFALITGFIHNRGTGAGSFEGSGIKGYVGYDDKNLYLALKTPYKGVLKARRWEKHDMALEGEESYEIFLCPPWTGTPDYVQLMGNPYGNRSDLRGMNREWTGRWFWEARMLDGEWMGEAKVPFDGISVQPPGLFSIWSMNIFNSHASAAWSPSVRYHDTGAFGVLRFDRNAPVIRPGEIRIEQDSISVPVELIGRVKTRHLTAGIEVYGEKDMLPVVSDATVLSLKSGERKVVSLDVLRGGIKEGRVVLFIKEGDTYLYYLTGKFPFAEPPVRQEHLRKGEAMQTPVAEKEKKDMTEEEKAYERKWTDKELGEEILSMAQWTKGEAGRREGVMSPWIPMKTTGQEIECWGRRYRYDNTLFPAQITSQGEIHLTEAPYLILKQGRRSQKIQKGRVSIEQVNEGLVKVVTTGNYGGFLIKIETEYEFDGMGRVVLKISHPDDPVAIDSLEFVMPVVKGKAELYHYTASFSGHPPGSDSGAVPKTGIILDMFRELIWLGDTKTGTCWFAEDMKNWQITGEEGIQKIERMRNGDTNLRITMCNSRFTLEDEWQVVFGIQATPTRPRRADFRVKSDNSTLNWNWFWGDGQYYPFQRNPEAARQQVIDSRGAGKDVMPCSSITFYGTVRFYESRFGKIDDPGLIHKEVMLWGPLWERHGNPVPTSLPAIPEEHTAPGRWYGKRYQPTGLTSFCAASPYQDYYLWRLEQLVEDTGLGAIYLDQPAYRCLNALHGCGYINYKGEWAPRMPIFAMREMVKRIRRIFYDAHGDARIRWHSSNQMLVPVISFVDTFWDGENYAHGELKVFEFYSRILSPERMRTQHTGIQFGFAPDLLPEMEDRYAPSPASTRDMMGYFFVHDGNVWPVRAHTQLVKFLRDKRFSYKPDSMDVSYYWQDKGLLAVTPENVYHILHYDRDKGLLILFNRSDEVTISKVKVDVEHLFGKGITIGVKDAVNGEVFKEDEKGIYNIPVEPRDLRMLEIVKR